MNEKDRFLRNAIPWILRNGKASTIKNVQAWIVSLAFLLLVAHLGSVGSALAATPTPTLRPIPPTPTSAYIYLRPTPTPFNINPPTLAVPFQSDGGPMADNAINMYRFANHDHILDFIGTGVLCLVCIGYLIKMAGRNTRNNG